MKSPEELLKTAGLKVTEQRRAILSYLLIHHGPFSVEDMLTGLADFDLATLYRNLTAFEEAKLVERCHFGDGLVRFELNHEVIHAHHEGHHHHLICTQCKKIVSVEVCVAIDDQKEITKMGYANLKHHLEFSGVCPACQNHSKKLG